MLVSTVMSRVRNVVGDVNALQFTDEVLLDWVNDGIRECAILNNLLQKRATTASVADQAAYSLPADILKLHSVKYEGTKLRILTLEEFDSYTGGGGTDPQSGVPVVCYVWANQLTLFPAPDTSSNDIVIDYIYDPAVILIGGIGVEVPLPVSYHPRIVDYCLAQVAQQDDDMQRYQVKMQEFITGVQSTRDQQDWENDLYPSISISARDTGGFWDNLEGYDNGW